MSLKETIDDDIKQAMLAKKKDELIALRSIKSMILLAQSEKGANDNLTEESEMRLLSKAVKQRKESAELFLREGRGDLAEKEKLEEEVIARYLPNALSEEEIREVLVRVIAELGASAPADMGRVMGVATKELAGKADGKVIAEMVRNLLAE